VRFINEEEQAITSASAGQLNAAAIDRVLEALFIPSKIECADSCSDALRK
jgi:hypothetical protein